MKISGSNIRISLAAISVIVFFPVFLFASTDVINLNAEYSSGLVKVQWQTSSEINVEKFIIEKSADGTNFNKLTTESAKGSSSSYSVFDLNPHSKNTVLYYRVKVVDYDGSLNISDPVSVRIETTGITATWGGIKALFR